jgi:D-arabinose 1-dehydrogenase-like Zn-dependent alcohol dehydrogenase
MLGTMAYQDADSLTLGKVVTPAGTTGAQTINKPTGTVNFAAAATSLAVTNSLVTANSIIICTVGTNDTTMKSVAAVATAGSFTLYANSAATAETRVNFLVL